MLVVEQGRCTGIVCTPHDAPGTRVTVRSRRDVVLTAGTFGSAQLLLLSGVGPREHLRSLGIPVVHDAPEVGANLRDHPISNLVYRAAKPVPPACDQRGVLPLALRDGRSRLPADRTYSRWREARASTPATNRSMPKAIELSERSTSVSGAAAATTCG